MMVLVGYIIFIFTTYINPTTLTYDGYGLGLPYRSATATGNLPNTNPTPLPLLNL